MDSSRDDWIGEQVNVYWVRCCGEEWGVFAFATSPAEACELARPEIDGLLESEPFAEPVDISELSAVEADLSEGYKAIVVSEAKRLGRNVDTDPEMCFRCGEVNRARIDGLCRDCEQYAV